MEIVPTRFKRGQTGALGMRAALTDYIKLPQCKRLINRIHNAQRDLDVKSIVVMSQFPDEGKRLCIASLAMGFLALLKKRVLIMDTVSQSKDDSFYCHAIVENTTMADSLDGSSHNRTGCIDIITTKSFNSSSIPVHKEANLFDCADFAVKPFLDSVNRLYDVIFLDTCALSEVDETCFDPLILAQHADASLIVSSIESYENHGLKLVTKELKKHQIHPLGVILNYGGTNGHN